MGKSGPWVMTSTYINVAATVCNTYTVKHKRQGLGYAAGADKPVSKQACALCGSDVATCTDMISACIHHWPLNGQHAGMNHWCLCKGVWGQHKMRCARQGLCVASTSGTMHTQLTLNLNNAYYSYLLLVAAGFGGMPAKACASSKER